MLRPRERRFLRVDPGDRLAICFWSLAFGCQAEALDALRDHARDHRRRELRRSRAAASRRAGAPTRPFFELADHARAHVVTPVVQLLLELVFDSCRFSSTTRISSRPSAKWRTPSGSSGHGIAT
jgi:hypothetical protein